MCAADEMSIAAPRKQVAPARTRPIPADPDEGVRLIRAFVRIRDRAVREAIINWVCEQAKHR